MLGLHKKTDFLCSVDQQLKMNREELTSLLVPSGILLLNKIFSLTEAETETREKQEVSESVSETSFRCVAF